jgi:hypothetical protein
MHKRGCTPRYELQELHCDLLTLEGSVTFPRRSRWRRFLTDQFEQIPFAAAEFAENPEPRCSCLLLLDTSGSMAGEPIAQLNQGIKVFNDEVRADRLASLRVEVAIVTFGPVKVETDQRMGNPRWIATVRKQRANLSAMRRRRSAIAAIRGDASAIESTCDLLALVSPRAQPRCAPHRRSKTRRPRRRR